MSHLPPGLPAMMPYLSVPDAEGLLAFLQAVFTVEVADLTRDEAGLIRHGAASVEGVWLEFSGHVEGGALPLTTAALHVYVADVDATFAKALAAGAVALSVPTQMPYGEKGATVRDPNGNHWHLATYNA